MTWQAVTNKQRRCQHKRVEKLKPYAVSLSGKHYQCPYCRAEGLHK